MNRGLITAYSTFSDQMTMSLGFHLKSNVYFFDFFYYEKWIFI